MLFLHIKTQRERLCIVVQIAKELKFIPENKILHGDLKPSNICITSSGLIKIRDFGLSKYLSKSSPEQRLYGVGTHFYSAPEFLKHKEMELKLHLLPKADSFSFGIIALKVLGFLVYSESELFRLNDKIRNGDIEEELNKYLHLPSAELNTEKQFETIVNTCYGTAKCFRNSPLFVLAYGKAQAEKVLKEESLKLITGMRDLLKIQKEATWG